jgi:hypothetical protein
MDYWNIENADHPKTDNRKFRTVSTTGEPDVGGESAESLELLENPKERTFFLFWASLIIQFFIFNLLIN